MSGLFRKEDDMVALLISIAAVLAVVVIGGLVPVVWFRIRDRRARRRGETGTYSNAPRTESPERHPRTPDFSDLPCSRNEPHSKPAWPRKLTVRGKTIGVASADICPACLERFFERHATTCAACDGPILPGMPVGQAWDGAKHPFTHMNFECTASGGLYCGTWGQGRLVTLHEMEPETFPPGTPNVMAHILATGEPHVTKIK